MLDRPAGVHARCCSRSTTRSSRLPRIARGAAADDRRKVVEGGALPGALSRRSRDGRRPGLSHRRRALRPPVYHRVAQPAAARRRRSRASAIGRRRLAALLAHRDVCSRRSIFQRYDGVVRGTTAIPLGYADAGVICPIPGAPFGVALGGRRQPALRQARPPTRRRACGPAKRCATSSRSARDRSGSPIV